MDRKIRTAVETVNDEGTGHADPEMLQLAGFDWLAHRLESAIDRLGGLGNGSGDSRRNRAVSKGRDMAAGGGIVGALVLLIEKLAGNL